MTRDEFRARLRNAWTEENGEPTWIEELLIDTYAEHMDVAMGRIFGDVVDWKPLGLLGVDVAPWLANELDIQGISPIRAALGRVRPNTTPPTALRGPAPSPQPDAARIKEDIGLRPTVFAVMDTVTASVAGPTEKERVNRDLVPLVRAAAAEVPLPARVEVLGGHLREFRAIDGALDQHDGEQKWGQFLDRWDLTTDLTSRSTPGFLMPLDMRAAADTARQAVRRHENGMDCWCGPVKAGQVPIHLDPAVPRGEGAFFDTFAADCVNPVVAPPATPDIYETVMAAFDRMLAPPRPPRRVEPIKLTRAQIDQLPKVDIDELPFTPTAFRLDGIPVVEVLTVEESTPHAEGWCLTVSQIVTGVYSAFDGVRPDYRKPLHMTRQQIERVMALLGVERPDDWEQTLELGGEVSQLLGRPVHLAHNAASSTPCIERWMDL